MTAAQGRSNRRRGAEAERAVVRYLTDAGYDARRYLAGDGRQPGDIDWHPLIVLEVKDVASSSWPSWCRQAAAAAGVGQVPVVVRRVRGVTDVGRWPARLPFFRGLNVRAGDYCAMKGLGDLWVETNFVSVVAAVARMDGRDDIADRVLARHGQMAGEA